MTLTKNNKELVRRAFTPWEESDSGPFLNSLLTTSNGR
jgi:hypothetical protein